MSKIEEYELHRTGWAMLIAISTIVIAGVFIFRIDNGMLSFIVSLSCSIIGCLAIDWLFAHYNRKIEKYKREHAEELS